MQRSSRQGAVQVSSRGGAGSGTLIAVHGEGEGRRGVVLTAWHVLYDRRTGVMSTSATARWQSGYTSTGVVLGSDQTNDVLAFIVHPPEGSRPIPVAEANPQVGSTLEYIGRGFRSWTSTTNGYPRYGNSDHSLAGVPPRARSGDSGGSVLHNGQLVGVITGFVGPRIGPPEHDTGPSLNPIHTLLARCAPWSLRRPPHRPQQPPRPASPPIAVKPQDDRVASLERKLEEQDERIAELIKRLEAHKPQDGADGSDGENGKDGKDAVVDIDALAAVIVKRLDARAVVTQPPKKRKMEYRGSFKARAGVVPRGK